MKKSCEKIRNALIYNLRRQDIMFMEKSDNELSIVRLEKEPLNPIISLICPTSEDLKKHGPVSGMEINGLSFFKFKLNCVKDQTRVILPIFNLQTNQQEFVIIPCKVLIDRYLSQENIIPEKGIKMMLRFWLTTDGLLFETNDIGVEGERFMIQGRMAQNNVYDFSEFLNNWEILK